MADQLVEIPLTVGDVLAPDPARPLRGGNLRLVPLVPVGGGKTLPCIWKSHDVVLEETRDDGGKHPANECLLLISRNPLLTLRAFAEVEAWKTFGEGVVEW